MEKYLYGAAVQGIQQFIFRTNELKDIVGASELVEQICTSAFDEFAKDGESIVRAAGNIKFIFNKRKDCEKAVREFPKKVMRMAPGITISQAVVESGDGFDSRDVFEKSIDKIEQMLKEQRNKPCRSVTTGLIGIKRANNTGLPVVDVKEFLDDAALQIGKFIKVKKLCEKSFGLSLPSHERIAYDISSITGKNDWIAVIHADGNGVGKVVREVGKKKDVFQKFSEKLDLATKEAANEAYEAVKGKFDENGIIPIRPVVLSGDDMTVIIRGDLAIDYTNAFIKAFEAKTKQHLGDDILKQEHVFANDEDCLTACAGIAFIKSSFPFYYGYQLAEELCNYAKKDTKAIYGFNTNHLPPSCLMFHKVQDSFIKDFEDIVKRELTAKEGLSFKYGPYYINNQVGKPTVKQLIEYCDLLNTENGDGVKSGIRNWISLRIESKNRADQRRRRMLQVFADDTAVKILTDETGGRCIAYDVLAYHTIMNQQTNEEIEV